MRSKCLITGFIIFSLFACNPAIMKVNPELKKNANALKVKGKQGWQFNRVLKYGQFKTSPVKGGWKTGTSIHFIMDFKEAEQRFKFNQMDTLGNKTKVYCVGKLNADDIDVLGGMLEIPVDVKDVFAATIIADSGKSHWKLVVYNIHQVAFTPEVKGELKFEDYKYNVKPVRELEQGSFGPRIIGFEFLLNEKIVAAVQTMDNGIVWLSNQLADDHKLIISSACSALMLRDDLDDYDD